MKKLLQVLLLTLAGGGSAMAETGRWTHDGPFGGDIRTLAVDPTSPSTVYAGARYGGLWRTDDGGDSWTAISQGLPDVSLLWPTSIVVDPLTPSTVYAGFSASGVWKSTDGGGRWTSASVGIDRPDVRSLAIDPESPSTLYALAEYRLMKSVDGAAGWQDLGRTATAIALDPASPSTLYAISENLLFRSTDGGASWEQTGPFRFGLPFRILAVDPSSPSTLYAASRSDGVLKSVDGGVSWASVNEGLTSHDVTALRLDSQTPAVLYAATADRRLFRSTDGAASWHLASEGLPIRLAIWDLAIDPVSPSTLYAGTEGGAFRSADGGATWSATRQGLLASFVRSLAVDPSSPSTVYAGTRGGVFKTMDGGATWTATSQGLDVLSVQALAVDPQTPSTVYAGTMGGGVFKTTDGGANWTAINEGLTRGVVQALAIDPGTPSTLYAASGVEVWKSVDGGANWRALATGDARARTLAIDHQHPEIVYAASPTMGVLRSMDGGETWSVRNSGIRASQVLTLAIDPQRPSTLYLGAINGTSGVYESTDGGETWRSLSRQVVPHLLAVDPLEPSTLYATNSFRLDPLYNGGVLRSRDGGRTWTDLGTGLTNRGVDALALDSQARTRVYAGTSGGGTFEIELARKQTVLELRDGRFHVEVEWRDFQGATGSGVVAEVFPPGDTVPLRSSDSTVVEFFSPGNWEVLAKVLDGRSINGNSWVFLAAATNVGFTTTITDTYCGQVRTYEQAAGTAARAVTDVEAFPECPSPVPRSCREGGGFLCLGAFDRFEARIEWRDFVGHTGFARQVRIPRAGTARSDDSGVFYFFTENNWELIVKVLDGCRVNGHYWVFGAATTNVGYTVRVTDAVSGQVRTYGNRLGAAAPALTDTIAFATCGSASSD